MKNIFKKFFGMTYEIDSKVFRKALASYPYLEEANGSDYLHSITKVWATKKGNETTVHIRTHRPGILIGKAGIQIGKIKEHMEFLYKSDVKIDIIEDQMFWHVYS